MTEDDIEIESIAFQNETFDLSDNKVHGKRKSKFQKGCSRYSTKQSLSLCSIHCVASMPLLCIACCTAECLEVRRLQ